MENDNNLPEGVSRSRDIHERKCAVCCHRWECPSSPQLADYLNIVVPLILVQEGDTIIEMRNADKDRLKRISMVCSN